MSRRVHRASDACLAAALDLLHETTRHLADERLSTSESDGKIRLAHRDVPLRLDWSRNGGPVHVSVGHSRTRMLQIRDWRPGSVKDARRLSLDLATGLVDHLSSSTLMRYDPFELAPVIADVATRVDADEYLVTLPTPWGTPASIRRRDAGGNKWSANLRRIDPEVMALLPVSLSCSISKDTGVASVFPTEVMAVAPGPVDLLRGLESLARLRSAA